MSEPPEPDVLRIMVATDSHLGYMERDPVRGMDSFAAFDEVLLQAKRHMVDFVLLGGDLFHENKPSRRTLYRTMDILRRRCMGAEPVSFQIISEQAQNFKLPMENLRDRKGHVNYEDPFVSVGLPIFSIHGNHDDPTREGGVEALAALDLLHVTNLVNYFGKSSKVDDVEVNPILIQKGETKLALYGMGSMRDERLNRMWQQKKVKFLQPLEDDDSKGFFNVFVLHQNRDLGRGKKNCIHESMIPEWMDLVIWGHEHECQIDPMESLVGTFRITQPGSSVATSLCEGEAVPKKVGILEVKMNNFRLLSQPLSQVRPFRMDDLVLNEVEGLDSTAANIDDAVGEVLAQKIEDMIKEIHEEEAQLQREPPEGQEYLVEKRDQVLVRLKVEHSDFPTLNNQRFGSQFMGKVANPSDLLLFYRRRMTGFGAGGKGKSGGISGLSDPIRPESLDDVRVEDLVMHNLETADKKLSLLVEGKLKIALEDFVDKGQKHAMNDLVKETLEGAQKMLRKEKAAQNAALIDDAVAKISDRERAKMQADKIRNDQAAQARSKASAAVRGGDGAALDSSGSDGDGNARGNGATRNGRSARAKAPRQPISDDDDDFADGVDMPAAATNSSRGSTSGTGAGTTRGRKPAARARNGAGSGASSGGGRRRGAAQAAPPDSIDLAGEIDDGNDDNLSDLDEKQATNNRQRVEAIDLSDDDGIGSDRDDVVQPPAKRGGGKQPQKPAATSRSRHQKSAQASARSAATSARAGTGRRASARGAARGRVTYTEADFDDDGSEVEEVEPLGGGDDDSFVPEKMDDDDDADDYASGGSDDFVATSRGRGRGGKSKGKASTTASSSRSKAAAKSSSRQALAAPASRGKRGLVEPEQGGGGFTGAGAASGVARKRRSIPAWASAASSSTRGRGHDNADDVASEVQSWGATR